MANFEKTDYPSPRLPSRRLGFIFGTTSRRVAPVMHRFGLIFAWAALVAVFGVLRPATFLTVANFSSIFGSQAVLVVLTLALLVTLTSGDFDVSVAFVAGLCTMIIAILNVNEGWPLFWAIAVALAVGMGVGVINGFIVVKLGVDSLIATLGTGSVIVGLVAWISNENTISGISPALVNWVSVESFLSIPLEFYYAIALATAMWVVLSFTVVGRHLLVVGRAREVARLSGLHVERMRWCAYVVSATLAALAGIMYAGTTGAADPSSFEAFLFPSFAAAFLGATAIVPGQFNPWGSVVAVYFLVTGITGLQLLGVQSFVHDVFFGSALVLSVVFAQLARGGRISAPREHLPPGASE